MGFFRMQFGEFVGESKDAPNGFNLSTSNTSLVTSILSVGEYLKYCLMQEKERKSKLSSLSSSTR